MGHPHDDVRDRWSSGGAAEEYPRMRVAGGAQDAYQLPWLGDQRIQLTTSES